jgi:hypothetical protein
LVVVVSTGAALALIGASSLMNWVFMTSLGKSAFEQQIFGAVSVAVSAFIALLPTLMLWAWRERRFVFVVLGVPVFLAFVAFSLSSAVGFAAQNRGGITEDRSLATSRLTAVKQEIAEAEAKRAALGKPRPAAVIEQTLHELALDRKWMWTKECQDATSETLRSYCRGYFELKAEAARAVELTRWDEKLDGLRNETRHYEEKGAGREADSQAAVLANLLGFQAIKIERGLTLFLAVLVEIGAALGLYFATGHIRAETKPAVSRGAAFIEPTPEPHPFKALSPVKLARAPVKQIAGPKPRRVPRMSQSS